MKHSNISYFIDFPFDDEFFVFVDKFALIAKTFFYNEIDVYGPNVFIGFYVDNSCFLLAVPADKP